MTEERTPYHAGKPIQRSDPTPAPGQVLPADLQRLIAFGRKVGATVVPLPQGDHILRISGPAAVILATLPESDGDTSP